MNESSDYQSEKQKKSAMAAGICQESRFAVLENSDPGDGSFLPLSNEFRKELVSLLKSLPECSLPLKLFRGKYAEHFGKPFSVREHGYAFLKDLLMAIPETVTVYKTETMIGSKGVPDTFVKLKPSHAIDAAPANASEVSQVPQQGSIENAYTKEQKERLDAFSREVAVLLKGQPECTMPKKDLQRKYRLQFGRGLHLSVKDAGCHKLRSFYKYLQTSHIVQFVGSGRNTLLKLTELQKEIGEVAPENSVKEEPICGTVNEAGDRKDIKSKEAVWADGCAIDAPPANASEVSQVPQGSKEAFDTKQQKELLDALGGELAVLLECQPERSILMKDLFSEYKHHFGIGLHSSLKKAGCKKLRDFFDVMPHFVEVVGSGPSTLMKLSGKGIGKAAPENSVKQEPKFGTVNEARAFFREELTKILECQPKHSISMGQLRDIFKERFGRRILVGCYNKYGIRGVPNLIRSMPEIFQHVGSGREAIVRFCATPGLCEDDGEAWLKWRQNQIDLFKETDDYKRYLEAVPKEQRRPDMPQTPDIHDRITNVTMSRWRKSIIRFKSEAIPDNAEVTEPAKVDSMKLKDNLCQALQPNTTENNLKHKTRLLMFSVELVELLKSKPSCFIGISEFVDSFEQHFGKKFNVHSLLFIRGIVKFQLVLPLQNS